MDDARYEAQSADQCQRGNAVPNGECSDCQPFSSLIFELDLIEGDVPGAHCKDGKNRDSKNPET